MRRGTARLGGIGAALALALAAFPVSATAGGDYPLVSTSFMVADGGVNAAEAVCPGFGDVAISGGTYNAAPFDERLWLDSTRPGDLDDPTERGSWMSEVRNVTDPFGDNSEAFTWAVCHTDGAGDYRFRRTLDVQVEPGKQVKHFRTCKDDEAVVGGGADVGGTAGDQVFLSSSAPRDDNDRDKRPDGWRVAVEADNIDSGDVTMDVYAVCDTERKPADYRYKTAEIEVGDHEQQSVTAICDVFEPRVGGGVRSHSKFAHELRIDSTLPDGDTGWTGFVDNVDTPDNEARKVTATAICLKA